MGFLKIAGADLRRRNLGGNRQHRDTRPVAIEKSVDQMQIARPAASGTHRQFACQMRLGPGGECGDLFMPHMEPLDLGLPAQRIRQPIQAVADDAIDAPNPGRSQRFRELVGYRFRHDFFSVTRKQTIRDHDDGRATLAVLPWAFRQNTRVWFPYRLAPTNKLI